MIGKKKKPIKQCWENKKDLTFLPPPRQSFMGKKIAFPSPPLKPGFADGKKITIMDCDQTYAEYKLCVNGIELPS